jgi:hypothetical protein
MQLGVIPEHLKDFCFKNAVSSDKAEAIQQLNTRFGLGYKYVRKLIPISETTFYDIVLRRGAYQ